MMATAIYSNKCTYNMVLIALQRGNSVQDQLGVHSELII